MEPSGIGSHLANRLLVASGCGWWRSTATVVVSYGSLPGPLRSEFAGHDAANVPSNLTGKMAPGNQAAEMAGSWRVTISGLGDPNFALLVDSTR